ncbi:hypothetical protein ACFLXT_03575 [Chloroflexota bacterium]
MQCTAGPVSPLLILSGPKLIEELNINDSYSTIGPGWRANSTIGRAVRLIMINIGHCWPGKPDMKAFGNPFKFVMLMAENEAAYTGVWDPIRVVEGFPSNQPTISVMPAASFRIKLLKRETATTDQIVAAISKEGKVKYDCRAAQWGMDNLIILNPTIFEVLRYEKSSRADVQKALFEQIQLPSREFFLGKEPSPEVGVEPLPEWLIEKGKANPDALVPLFMKPESIKLIVAGAPGPAMIAYVDTWGFGPAHFMTRAIKLPRNWENLLEKHKGWESPTFRNLPDSGK